MSRPLSSTTDRRAASTAQRGFSLIELMVGMVVALVLSLVMFQTMLFAEGQRRTTSSGNDAQQAGTIGSFTLERYLRMGGAGMDQIPLARGCVIQASLNGSTGIPLPSTVTAPFSGLNGLALPMSPILIANAGVDADTGATPAQNTTPDVLVVMAGTHPSVDTWFQSTAVGAAGSVQVKNSLGLATGDILLAVESSTTNANAGKCVVAQVTSAPDTTTTDANYLQSSDSGGKQISIGGALTSSAGLAFGGTGLSANSLIADLGTAPYFLAFGVANPGSATSGALSELRSYDLLHGTTQSLADGVVNIQAVYGLSTTGSANPYIITSWQAPVGAFSLNSLRAGTAASIANINRIRAIRLAIVTRSSVYEKAVVDGPSSFHLFSDLSGLTTPADVTIANTGDDLHYRYRVSDVTITLRNF